MFQKKVLNVGGNSKKIKLPKQYNDYEHILLDIDPKGKPDIVCDALKMKEAIPPNSFDAIYCSHNLEHFYYHEVPVMLNNFRHVLTDQGFVEIRVPNLKNVIELMIAKDKDIEDFLYDSPSGPITILDVLYGYQKKIQDSGQNYFAHKTGFTPKSLVKTLRKNGFSNVFVFKNNSLFEIRAIGFKTVPNAFARNLFKLPNRRKVPA